MDVTLERLRQDYKTEFDKFYQEQQLENERNGRVDQAKSEEGLNLNFALQSVSHICRRYQTRFDESLLHYEFSSLTTNASKTEANFDALFKYLIGEHKEVRSSLALAMVELIEFIYTNAVSQLQA